MTIYIVKKGVFIIGFKTEAEAVERAKGFKGAKVYHVFVKDE